MVYTYDAYGNVLFDNGLGAIRNVAPRTPASRFRAQGRAGNAPGMSACADREFAAMSAASTGDVDFYQNFERYGRGVMRTCAQRNCSFVQRLPTNRAERDYCDKLSTGGYVCCK